MPGARQRLNRSPSECRALRGVRPDVEGLESRLLLYSTFGDQWTYDSRITYSLMPDGTSVGGVPSVLFQTLNAKYPTATWEGQIEAAASLWESVTNVNLALVPDGGEPDGCAGDQQDDPRFGDIRIGMVPLSSSVLAVTFVPPQGNGGTDAGDILLNSNVDWQIGSNYDLETVVAHEFGHALGLGESTVSSAVMYGTYNGIKQDLASDDIEGIDSIYGTRQFDQFNQGGQRNDTYETATNINSYLNNGQIAIPGLDITTSGDSEWFYVNVPSDTNGTMSVTAQSSDLSMLSPKVEVYNSSLSLIGDAGTAASLGATVTVSTSVGTGQGYYIKVLAAGGAGPIGGYGLLVNFTSHTQSAIAAPNTMVPEQASTTAGETSNDNAPSGIPLTDDLLAAIGSLTGLVDEYVMPGSAAASAVTAVVTDASSTTEILEDVAVSTAGTLTSTTDADPVQLLDPTVLATLISSGAGPTSIVLQAVDQSIDDGDLL
jgi:Matrixin